MRALAIIVGCCIGGSIGARSPFNAVPLVPPDSNAVLRIIITGHLHGASDSRNGLPAATLLASLDTINSLGATLFLSTGDLFMDRAEDIPAYERAFFSRLHMPFYNVPGNHDLGMPGYVDRFGPTHQVLDMERLVVVLLDTERDNGSINGEQLNTLRALADTPQERPILILAHRPLWVEDDPLYSDLFVGNTRSMWPTNFRSDVAPLLDRMARHAPVFWVSGSMAGGAPASIFFHQHAPNITYVQSAIRDEVRDALLIMDVAPHGELSWSALSLTGRTVPPVRSLDAPYWRANASRKEAFQWRLLPYLALKTVRSGGFWWGLAAGCVVALVARVVLRRWI